MNGLGIGIFVVFLIAPIFFAIFYGLFAPAAS